MTNKLKTFSDCQNLLAPLARDIFALGNSLYHGLGLLEILPKAKVICLDDDDLLPFLAAGKMTVFSLGAAGQADETVFRSSANLLGAKSVRSFIKENSTQPKLYVPKVSRRLEIQAQAAGAKLLGASSQLNHLFEDKISFTKKMAEWGLASAPRQDIEVYQPVLWDAARNWGWPLVVQFNRGIAGEGTKFLENQQELVDFAAKNVGRRAVMAKYIKGKTITLNACATHHGTVIGKPFWQITGEKVLNRNRGGTGGNDYAVNLELSKKQSEEVYRLAKFIGDKMISAGYRGIFGLDLMVEEKITVIEINARPTASIPTYTHLEHANDEIPLLGLHLLEFLGVPYDLDVNKLNAEKAQADYRGSKIIIRNTSDQPTLVKRDLTPGIYDWLEDSLVFRRPAYRLTDIRETGECLIWTAKAGRQVNVNIEMVIVYFRQSVLDSQWRLRPEIKKIIAYIKAQLSD